MVVQASKFDCRKHTFQFEHNWSLPLKNLLQYNKQNSIANQQLQKAFIYFGRNNGIGRKQGSVHGFQNKAFCEVYLADGKKEMNIVGK